MDYTHIPPPPNANEGWLAHRVGFYLSGKRLQELLEFLEGHVGPHKAGLWRTERIEFSGKRIYRGEPYNKKPAIRFLHKSHAMLFKLTWQEDEDPMIQIYQALTRLTKTFGSQQMSQSAPNSPSMGIRRAGQSITTTPDWSAGLLWSFSPHRRLSKLEHLRNASRVESMDVVGEEELGRRVAALPRLLSSFKDDDSGERSEGRVVGTSGNLDSDSC